VVYVNDGAGLLQYNFGTGASWAIARYDLVSANDVPERDPKDWQFQGSSDGVTWATLDTRPVKPSPEGELPTAIASVTACL